MSIFIKSKIASFVLATVLSVGLLPGFLSTSAYASIHEKHKNDCYFKLKDFVGTWIIELESVGGVDGTSGHSNNLLARVNINKHGACSIDFAQSVVYTGPVGDPLVTRFFTPDDTRISLELIDKKFGLVTLSVNRFLDGKINVYTLLAFKNNGVVNELTGHRSNSELTGGGLTSGAHKIKIRRQFE